MNKLEYVVMSEVKNINTYTKIAEFYKALGDETRIAIVSMLAEQDMCVCEIIDRLNMSQSAISHHLKILKQAGVVNDSRDGKWIYYSLNEKVFEVVFQGERAEVLENYSQPLKNTISQKATSQIEKDPTICDTLTAKQNKK